MRVYFYLSNDELIYAAVHGLRPAMPQSEVNKTLQRYIEKHPKTINVGKGNKIQLTTEAVYGGLVTSALNLVAKIRAHQNGAMLFAHLNNKRVYPAITANYVYRGKLYELYLLREHHPDIESGKYKSVDDLAAVYAMEYWDSVKNLKDTRMWVLEEADRRYGNLSRSHAIRRVAEDLEVLLYQSIHPYFLYVKLRQKTYVPFMEWMYVHRGLYFLKMRNAKTPEEKVEANRIYNEFLQTYIKYRKALSEGKNVANKGGAVYVPPKFKKH